MRWWWRDHWWHRRWHHVGVHLLLHHWKRSSPHLPHHDLEHLVLQQRLSLLGLEKVSNIGVEVIPLGFRDRALLVILVRAVGQRSL